MVHWHNEGGFEYVFTERLCSQGFGYIVVKTGWKRLILSGERRLQEHERRQDNKYIKWNSYTCFTDPTSCWNSAVGTTTSGGLCSWIEIEGNNMEGERYGPFTWIWFWRDWPVWWWVGLGSCRLAYSWGARKLTGNTLSMPDVDGQHTGRSRPLWGRTVMYDKKSSLFTSESCMVLYFSLM